jgi:uncharacterized protein (DUF58 family)
VWRSWLAGMTTRGTSFLAAGSAAAIAGYALDERSLLCVGVVLMALPVFTVISARRARYRLSCSRSISPPRIPAGGTAQVSLRLHNISRLPTGLMLAEDSIPYALGTRPRYVLDNIERDGTRVLTYTLRSDLRGKFEVGPLQLRVADSFGLVEISRSFSGRTTFVVTPRVYPLARTMISRAWAGEGDGRSRLTASAGEDDVIPRNYRDGDDMRRVHWRSTARYGELMVRREEQQWRNRATVLLDTRAAGHMGSGPSSSFEFAVSAAASIGVHLAQQGLSGQVHTDQGTSLAAGMMFEDMLLDALAVIKPSRTADLAEGLKALRTSAAGVTIAIVGRLDANVAEQLASCRKEGSQAIALLLAVSTWAAATAGGQADHPELNPAAAHHALAAEPAEIAPAAAVLRAAGWHVISLTSATPLDLAWEQLPRAAEMLVPAASLAGRDPAGGWHD